MVRWIPEAKICERAPPGSPNLDFSQAIFVHPEVKIWGQVALLWVWLKIIDPLKWWVLLKMTRVVAHLVLLF